MSVVRQFLKYSDMKTFKGLHYKNLNVGKSIFSMKAIQFVFDSYLELTVKDSERRRRGNSITYELVDLLPSTSLPSMIDNFGKSENNKRKLINAAYKYYIDN